MMLAYGPRDYVQSRRKEQKVNNNNNNNNNNFCLIGLLFQTTPG